MTSSTTDFKQSVLAELLKLNFNAFVQTIASLLKEMGYEDVEPTARKNFVGHNTDGGFDLKAYRRVPGGRRLVVVKVKQFDSEKVFRRTLDELRGVVLREGAAEGLIVTTSSFSDSVSQPEFSSASVAPLRLIDGAYLAGLMTVFRVGVEKTHLPAHVAHGRYRLDREFFAEMQSRFAGGGRPDPAEPEVSVAVFTIRAGKRRS